MLLAPPRTGPAHVVEFRPVRIEYAVQPLLPEFDGLATPSARVRKPRLPEED